MKLTVFLTWITLSAVALSRAEQPNLVANGSFELSQMKPGQPDHWSAPGNAAVRQALRVDAGRDGQRAARLECSEFGGDGPDFHAMICQVGRVRIQAGRWYRLTFWAKGDRIQGGAVEVALVNMRRWENAGLAEAFRALSEWEKFEFLFRARTDLPAEASRLQFWFKSIGTLWLDDVVLAESEEGQQWYPQIPTEGLTNFLPNSSFECGPVNWGGYTYGLKGWAGNLYRLEGQLDDTVAMHGTHSLKIRLTPEHLPVFYFDYYEPVRQPVRRVLVANQGWFRVPPGEPLVLSAFLRADAEGVAAQMVANEAPNRLWRQQVVVGREWRRYEFVFTPSQPFLFIALGLDLEASQQDTATLWVDAIQLERGAKATAYQPRQPVESFIETGREGNLFTDPDQGAVLTLRTFNDSDHAQSIRGNLSVTDFFDRKLLDKELVLQTPPHSGRQTAAREIGRGQRGFYRATWIPARPDELGSSAPWQAATQSLRCAIIDPLPAEAPDTPFGFNHAYPWDFLVGLARQAGILWWRDWSAQWQVVEPEPGRFDFTLPDAQIQRVLRAEGEVAVLLPFPSAAWSSTARPDEVEQAAGNNRYLAARLPVAYAPKDLETFGRYAARVARHYGQPGRRRVTTYQILNEPVYTSYALPKQFGYGLEDYLRLLKTAHGALKAVHPACRIVGGISANLEAGLTRDFVTGGGLRLVDVFDLHMYNPARPAESYEESFRQLAELMRNHGGPKPIWITEWGCYADDDPACFPQTVGDATMNRCRWPSERAATEHLVKFAAIGFAHGLRKIFFHAGTCGPINGPDAGGVLFEYGGAPRKMLPGVAALTRLFGVPHAFLEKVEREGFRAYLFEKGDGAVAVAWSGPGPAWALSLPADVAACDIMGNNLPPAQILVSTSPVFLVSTKVKSIQEAVSSSRSAGGDRNRE